MGKTLIAIPCYNCEVQIPRVLNKIYTSLKDKVDLVLIIENQSNRDNTLKAAVACAQKLDNDFFKIIQNYKNYGLGGTHKIAINYAIQNQFDYIAFIHGDDQTLPQELAPMIDLIKKDNELSAVLGARFILGAKLYGYNFFRKCANIGLTLLYSIISFRRTYELGAGLSIHKVDDFKDKTFETFTNDFNFYCFMLLNYYSNKSKLKFVPISYYETDQISNVGNWHIGVLTLKCLFLWRLFGLEKFSHVERQTKAIN